MNDELTVKQAAERSGYSMPHIRWLARMDRIVSRRIGERMLLIAADSLTQYTKRMVRLGTRKHAS